MVALWSYRAVRIRSRIRRRDRHCRTQLGTLHTHFCSDHGCASIASWSLRRRQCGEGLQTALESPCPSVSTLDLKEYCDLTRQVCVDLRCLLALLRLQTCGKSVPGCGEIRNALSHRGCTSNGSPVGDDLAYTAASGRAWAAVGLGRCKAGGRKRNEQRGESAVRLGRGRPAATTATANSRAMATLGTTKSCLF